MKKILGNILKVLVSVGLLYLIFRKLDLQTLKQILKTARALYFIPGVIIYALAIFFSALRWQTFLDSRDIKLGLFQCFKYYLISIFAGNFLPSGGLDVVRAYYAGRAKSFSKAMAVTIMDRLSGFYAILFFLILALIFLTVTQKGLFFATLVGIAVLLLFNIFVFSPPFKKMVSKFKATNITRPVISFLNALYEFRANYQVLIKTLPLSILIQLLFSLTPYVLAPTVNTVLPLKETLFLLPIVNFVMMIPISISGLGVREGAFIVIYGNLIGKEKALIISLLYYLSSLILSLAGAILFLFDKPQKNLEKQSQ